MKKAIKQILISLLILLLFTACSSSIKSRVLKVIKESPVANSYYAYTDWNDRWYNFKDQKEEVQEKYLIYLNDIVDYISSLELIEISADEFKGSTGVMIKIFDGNHEYVLHSKEIWPDKDFLKFSIDEKDEYYKLKDGDGEELINLLIVSENAPFNVISFYEYLDNEVK